MAIAMEPLEVEHSREELQVCCIFSRSPRSGDGKVRENGSANNESAATRPRTRDAFSSCSARMAATGLPQEASHKACVRSPTVRTHSAQEIEASPRGRKLPNFHRLAHISVAIDEKSTDRRCPSPDPDRKNCGDGSRSDRAQNRRNPLLPSPNSEKHLLPCPKKKDISTVAHPLPEPPILRPELSGAQVNEAGENKETLLLRSNKADSKEAVPSPSYSRTAKGTQVSRSEKSNEVAAGSTCKSNAPSSSSKKENPRSSRLLPGRLGGGATLSSSAPAAVVKLQWLPDGGLTSPSKSPSPRSLCPRKWRKGAILGQGKFGIVHEGLNLEDGSFFAVKVSSSEDLSSQIQQEIGLLSKLEHPNIVRYLGSSIENGRLCIFMELVRMGSLQTILQRYKRFEETTIRTYTRQILHGLVYLHSQRTIHRDIKCANILVDVNGQVKLADFGVAKQVGDVLATSMKGTPLYMAPEVLTPRHGSYSFSADIWSLGCTVLEMANGRLPWSDVSGFGFLFMVESGKLPPMPENLGLEGRDFVGKCLKFHANDRPTASELLQHPFLSCVLSQEPSAPYVPSSQPSLRADLFGQG